MQTKKPSLRTRTKPTEQDERILENLRNKIEYHSKKEKEYKKCFNDDFEYAFRWFGESMYTNCIILNELEYIQRTSVTPIREDIEFAIQKYTSYIMKDYNVREESTSSLSREASIFKFKAYLQIIEFLKSII